jgi:hypothetical protein
MALAAEKKSQAVGCSSDAHCVTSLDVWVLPEMGYARTAGGVRVVYQVVGASPLDVLLVGDGLSQVEATREIPVRAQVKTRAVSFSPPTRFDRRRTGLSDPVPPHQISGEVGSGAESYPPDGLAKPDLGTRADAMRHLYDHADVVWELGRRARASVTGTHAATAAVASLGKRGAASTGAGGDR